MEINFLGCKLRLFCLLAVAALGFLICLVTVCSCSKVSLKEGLEMFQGAAIDYMPNSNVKNSWSNKAETYSKDMGYDGWLEKHKNYKGTPVPLSPGNLDFFQDNQFKPECCPSTYTSSDGCACTSIDQLQYLSERGGNNVTKSLF